MKTRLISLLILWPTLSVSLTGAVARGAEPEIVGSAKFGGQVRQALKMLRARDPAAYAIVTGYIGRIQEGARSGMWAYKTPPTFEVNDATAFYSVTWCAATMAHDSLHAKLYRDYKQAHGGGAVPDAVWTGSVAERQCMRHQLTVMRRIGAPTREITYAENRRTGITCRTEKPGTITRRGSGDASASSGTETGGSKDA